MTLSVPSAAAAVARGENGAATTGAVPPPRLVRAAHEFEAQMMQELMKPLNHGSALAGSGDDEDQDEDSGSLGAIGQFASEALGRAMSEQGGLGIASSILKKLSPAGNHDNTVPVTRNGHFDTVMKTLK